MENNIEKIIKIGFVSGLQKVVLDEARNLGLDALESNSENAYLKYEDSFEKFLNLKTAQRLYLITKSEKYNPYYISKHKSILGDLVKEVLNRDDETFRTFKISCAGSDSSEIRSIARYIESEFSLAEQNEADLKIHLIKIGKEWEIGVQITKRPLSQREYRFGHMKGAMDPTIACALNTEAGVAKKETYLNVFSGSSTLMIEAALNYPNLKSIVGFDNNKEHLSLAFRSVKKAGLIDKVKIIEADIFDNPDLGKFDVITSDLPFGMVVSKDEDLGQLYSHFVEYCEHHLQDNGILAVYTAKADLFAQIISKSRFTINREYTLKLDTNSSGYIYPKILVCTLK